MVRRKQEEGSKEIKQKMRGGRGRKGRGKENQGEGRKGRKRKLIEKEAREKPPNTNTMAIVERNGSKSPGQGRRIPNTCP